MNDIVQTTFNKYTEYPNASYNLISYLMSNNDMIFKLLRYADPQAWNKPNLTMEEKANLIYSGEADMSQFRIFQDCAIDDSWLQEACQIRIYPAILQPTTYIYGKVVMAFEVYAHAKVNHLSNHAIRTDVVIQQLIQTLNGADVGEGIGRLFFDLKGSSQCGVKVIGSLPYKGKLLTMVNYSLG
jgi:hypothetical protein